MIAMGVTINHLIKKKFEAKRSTRLPPAARRKILIVFQDMQGVCVGEMDSVSGRCFSSTGKASARHLSEQAKNMSRCECGLPVTMR